MPVSDLKQLEGEENERTTEEKPKEKRGRGWPKGKPRGPRKNKPEQPSGKAEGLCAPFPTAPNPLFISGVNFIFDRWSLASEIESIRLKEKEAEDLALSIEQVIATYLPEVDSKHVVILNLIMSLSNVIGPRIREQQKRRKKKRESADPR